MKRISVAAVAAVVLAAGVTSVLAWPAWSVSAQQPIPGPKNDSVGVEGRISSPPPTRSATIVSPANGATFTSMPINVTGSCPDGTIVRITSNNIFVGSANCNSGSYNLQISLFSGRNDLVAQVYDALDQQGPNSSIVTINYNDPQFAQFGSQVLLTSQFARRAADPNSILQWPVIISSGSGPYAVSIDWGDGTPTELRSQQFAGLVDLRHTYLNPGVYKVIIKVVDRNGSSAFLQVVAVVNGPGGANRTVAADTADPTVITRTRVLWEPMAAFLLFALVSFWLGRRYELAALRKRLEREYR